MASDSGRKNSLSFLAILRKFLSYLHIYPAQNAKLVHNSEQSHVKKIVLVTQATARIGTCFCIYELTNGQEYCEYFHHRRKSHKHSKKLALQHSPLNRSKIEQALDLRQKMVYYSLDFYRDILTDSKTQVILYTDLADYNFTKETNFIINKIESSYKATTHGFKQVKHASPNQLFHVSTTIKNYRRHDNQNISLLIQDASVQLQKNNVCEFKNIIGNKKKYSRITIS